MQVTALAYSGQHSRLLSTGEDSRLVCWNMEMPRLERNNLQTHYYRRSLKLERNYLQTFTGHHTFESEYILLLEYAIPPAPPAPEPKIRVLWC